MCNFKDNMEIIEIQVDEELVKQVEVILKPLGMTIEEAVTEFFRFCINPEMHDETIASLTKWRDEQATPNWKLLE